MDFRPTENRRCCVVQSATSWKPKSVRTSRAGSAAALSAGADVETRAAERQKQHVARLTLLDETIGEFVNERPIPGLTFGWGPRGIGAVAFSERDRRLVLLDQQRHKMHTHARRVVLAIAALTIAVGGGAQTPPAPIPPHPSTQLPANLVTGKQMEQWEKELSNWGRWGPTDQRGTLNLITPQKTMAAVRLVKEGVSVSLYRFPDLDKAIDTGNMNAETKHWMTTVDPQTGKVRGALDAISFAIHDGGNTHMDALCHYAVQSNREHAVVYNGHPQDLDERGCKADAIDQMGPGYVTRGILVDMPLLKGVQWLEARTPIYVADLEAWERFANVKIGAGDAIFIRTGRWARRAKTGPWNAAREIAGLHASVLPWLKARDVAVIGAEGVADVQPSGVEGWPRPIHDIAIPIMGTPLVDNGYFEDLAPLAARLKRWEFMVSWTIMRVPNGTASPFTALATF